MGKLFVIDGLDGSGKATQTELVLQRLLKLGHNARCVSFPDYDSPSSGPVKMYLSGELSQDANAINAYAASSFFSVDRYCRYMSDFKKFYDEGGIIVCDRYTTANAIHQCTKLPKEKHDVFVDWLFDFEYNKLGIPKPDAVIFLSLSVELSSRLMDKRYESSGERDIHEKDKGHQSLAFNVARKLARQHSWHEIDCEKGGNIRPRDEIADEILDIISKQI